MTNEERAELALAVGRRVRPDEWRFKLRDGKVLAGTYIPDHNGDMSWCYVDTYDPTVPGADSAEALRWLWQRSDSVTLDRWARVVRCEAEGSASRKCHYGLGDTPEVAVCRAIEAWPKDADDA